MRHVAAAAFIVCLSFGAPAVTHAQGGASTFTVGTASAARGTRALGSIKVAAGTDPGYEIPVAVIHGAQPGPVLAVVAGSHGTEYASIVAVEMMIGPDGPSAIDPATLAGTLILVPLVNVASFERITPHLNPIDNKNMNRFYPGTATGTQTERASLAITKEVIEKSDHVIDLHGGDLDENLRPYTYWTVTGNTTQDAASRAMALAFGLEHIIISTDRPKDPNGSRYLENTATTRGKPSITAEAGRSGPVDPKDALALVNGIRGVMAHLKMTRTGPPPVAKPVWIERLANVAAEQDGMFYPDVDRGGTVVKGKRIGVVRDYWNRTIAEITAPEGGVVLFVRAVPSLKKGDTLISIGVAKQGS